MKSKLLLTALLILTVWGANINAQTAEFGCAIYHDQEAYENAKCKLVVVIDETGMRNVLCSLFKNDNEQNPLIEKLIPFNKSKLLLLPPSADNGVMQDMLLAIKGDKWELAFTQLLNMEQNFAPDCIFLLFYNRQEDNMYRIISSWDPEVYYNISDIYSTYVDYKNK